MIRWLVVFSLPVTLFTLPADNGTISVIHVLEVLMHLTAPRVKSSIVHRFPGSTFYLHEHVHVYIFTCIL